MLQQQIAWWITAKERERQLYDAVLAGDLVRAQEIVRAIRAEEASFAWFEEPT
jgi:hypothetical protein